MRGFWQVNTAIGTADERRLAQRVVIIQGHKCLARFLARHHALYQRHKPIARARTDQQAGRYRPGKVVQDLRARFQVHHRGNGLAIATPTRQGRHRNRVHPAIAAQHHQLIDRAAFKRAVQGVARFEAEAVRLMAVAGTRAHPAFFRHHHGHRLVHHLHFGNGFFLFLDDCAARVGKLFGVGLNLFDHQALERRGVAQNVFQLALLFAQFCQLLFDRNRFQARQLAQSNFQNIFGLAIAQIKSRNQRRLGLIAGADDGNHLVNVQQNELAALQNMDTVFDLVQPVLRATGDGDLAELDPLFQHLAQRFLRGFAVDADHRQVDGRRGLQAGMRQQAGNQLGLRRLARLGLEHQAHRRVLARLISHAV